MCYMYMYLLLDWVFQTTIQQITLGKSIVLSNGQRYTLHLGNITITFLKNAYIYLVQEPKKWSKIYVDLIFTVLLFILAFEKIVEFYNIIKIRWNHSTFSDNDRKKPGHFDHRWVVLLSIASTPIHLKNYSQKY